MDWKQFVNWYKAALVIEATVLYFTSDRSVADLAGLVVLQYGLFFPVDASLIIKNIKGVQAAVTGKGEV